MAPLLLLRRWLGLARLRRAAKQEKRPGRKALPLQKVALLGPCIAALWGATFPSKTGCALSFAGALGLVLCSFAARQRHRKRARKALAFSVILVTSCLFALRGFHWQSCAALAEKLASEGVSVTLTLRVARLPQQSESKYGGQTSLHFTGEVLSASTEASGPLEGRLRGQKVSVRTYGSRGIAPGCGDVVVVKCKFTHVRRAMNPGEFDERRYLQSKRIFYAAAGTIQEIHPDRRDSLAAALLRVIRLEPVTTMMRDVLDQNLPQDDSAVLKGILLGEDGDISKPDIQDFRRSGLYRFLSVTGFHIELAARVVEKAGTRLTRKRGFPCFLGASAALCLGQLAGWTAGSIRAATCCSMRLLSYGFRARYDTIAGLSLAGLLTAWAIPFPLQDAGFKLSFAGSLGAWAGRRYPGRFHMLLVLVPMMAATFQEVSAAGLLLGGFWMGILACLIPLCLALLLVPKAWAALGWAPHLMLRGIRVVSSQVSSIPLSTWAVFCPTTAELTLWYAILGLWCLQQERAARRTGDPRSLVRKRRSSLTALGLACFPALACCLLILASLRVCLPWPEIIFLSVGQGDCAVARYRKTTVIIDTGTPEAFAGHVLPYLRRQGLNQVDLAVISHLHSDHVGGAPSLCEQVRLGGFLTAKGTAKALENLLLAESSGHAKPTVTEAEGGKWYRVGSFLLYVCDSLPSPDAAMSGDLNEASLIVLLYTDKGRLLAEFWGDATAPAIQRALPGIRLDTPGQNGVWAVKVPHHGSKDSLVSGFYDRLDGGIAIVSVGSNAYGHPSPEAISMPGERGLSVFRTDRTGGVTVTFLRGVRARAFVR